MNSNFTITDCSYQPLDLNTIQGDSFTLMGESDDHTRCYYRINDENNLLSLTERINKIHRAQFENLLVSDLESLRRESVHGKKELILVAQASFKGLSLPPHQTKQELMDLVRELNELWNLLPDKPKTFDISSLAITRGKLKTLPKVVGNLAGLKELFLTSNYLRSFPESACNLSELQILDLGFNALNDLPDSIGNLKKLQKLYFENNNELHSLPESFCDLEQLQSAVFSFNWLERLPALFGNLSQLQSVSFECNQLGAGAIPESFGNLKKLERLNLSGNRLSDLPESFGNLPKLVHVALSHNRFTSIPACLYRLPRSCEVDFEDNLLTHEAIRNVKAILDQPNYNGPKIRLSIGRNDDG